MAEVVAHYYPKLVELHNYSPASASQQKIYNWTTLNQKVLRRLGFHISKVDIDEMVNCTPGAIERTLLAFMRKLSRGAPGTPPKPGGSGIPPPDESSSSSYSGGGNSRGPAAAEEKPTPLAPAPEAKKAAAAPAEGPVAAPGRSDKALFQGGTPPTGGRTRGAAADGELKAAELLKEKDEMISELRETVDILEVKVHKLEQLVRLKDAKITALTTKLQQAGL